MFVDREDAALRLAEELRPLELRNPLVLAIPRGGVVTGAVLARQLGAELDVVLSRKLPPLVDVRDVSTDDVRIALELKKDADERMVMAYLFKHTPLQTSFVVNLTCLVPTEGNAEVGRPERLDLHQMLFYFLHFRLEVVTKRLEHELARAREAWGLDGC